jgi:hypothetical protein
MHVQNLNNTVPPLDDKEMVMHHRAIQKLIDELEVPAEAVSRSYREILDVLNKDAKVRVFLPILVSREVRARLLHK